MCLNKAIKKTTNEINVKSNPPLTVQWRGNWEMQDNSAWYQLIKSHVYFK